MFVPYQDAAKFFEVLRNAIDICAAIRERYALAIETFHSIFILANDDSYLSYRDPLHVLTPVAVRPIRVMNI